MTLFLYLRDKNICLYKYLYTNLYNSIIHNSQNISHVHQLINEERNVVYTNNGTVFSHKNEVLIHIAKWISLENIMLHKEAIHKRPYVIDSLYMNVKKI